MELTRRRALTRTAAMIAAAAMLLSSCQRGTSTIPQQSPSAPSSTATASLTASRLDSKTPDELLSLLPQQADLPPGWTVAQTKSSGEDGSGMLTSFDPKQCSALLDYGLAKNSQIGVDTLVSPAHTDGGPGDGTVIVAAHKDPAGHDTLKEIGDALKQCGEFTTTDTIDLGIPGSSNPPGTTSYLKATDIKNGLEGSTPTLGFAVQSFPSPDRSESTKKSETHMKIASSRGLLIAAAWSDSSLDATVGVAFGKSLAKIAAAK